MSGSPGDSQIETGDPVGVLARYKVVVFDMDGVLWTMNDPIHHSREAVERCHTAGARVFYLTNNASISREDYVHKLARFGLITDTSAVITSAHTTAAILSQERPDARVVMIGGPGLRQELETVGLRMVPYAEGDSVDYAVVGWDTDLSYQKLAQVHGAIVRGGAEFIATNRDATYPDAGGRTLPGGGSIVAAVACSTGREPRTIGKPEPHTLRYILEVAGCAPHECLMVGDRLDTDIAVGRRVGADTALVLTGVTTAADVAAADPTERPDHVWEDLRDLR